MAPLMTSYVFRQSCMRLSIIFLPTGLFLSFLPLSPSLVLSLTFLFNYLMSPLLAQTPIEMWAAPSALNRLCTSDLWSFLCLTVCMCRVCVCVSLSVPIMCVSRRNLSVLSVCGYAGFLWAFARARLRTSCSKFLVAFTKERLVHI